jgi:hypothetical protein
VAAVAANPLPISAGMVAPTGRLRLLDNVFALSATDANGASVQAPIAIAVAPSDAALAAVAGDPNQLVLAYLDPASGAWIGLPTTVDGSGRLTASLPVASTVAVFRQAPTFWVVPQADLSLVPDGGGDPVGLAAAGAPVEIVAAQGTAYAVRLGDGTLAWLDATQVTNVPAPDALPPLPPEVEAARVGAQSQDVPPDVVVQAALAQRDWSDTSLGCPEPGRAYAQIIIPGYVITIDTADMTAEVEVHTDEGSRAVIC